VRSWKLNPKDPMNLVIAADTALNPVDPLDDQIWEVTFGVGEPPAFAIRTRYGMRAVEARYFPVFIRGNRVVIDPRDYFSPPVAHTLLPNYLDFTCSPLQDVEVRMEYWVPGSKILAGRISITNLNPGAGKLQVDWVGQVTPLGEGEPIMPETFDLNTVLTGSCGGIAPVCFISGGCEIGGYVYPSLSLQLQPRSIKTQVFTWASAAMTEKNLSYHVARNNAFRNWEAEISRVESVNEARWVEIYTGREDWDAVLNSSQKTGFSLVSPGQGTSKQTFLHARNPQTGFPPRVGDANLAMPETTQTAWESLYLCALLLPGGMDLVHGFLENLLNRQHPDGSLDWGAGGGSRPGRINAQPVIAQLALELAPYLPDEEWLRETLPKLSRFFLSWFTPQADRDGDGFPEWRASGQSGWLEENIPWIDRLESPGLAALLLKEAESIRRICDVLDEPLPMEIETVSRMLASSLLECWDGEAELFRYRDFETHLTEQGEILLEASENGKIPIKRKFHTSRGLALTLQTDDGLRKPLFVTVRGRSLGKPCSLEVKSRDFSWKGDAFIAILRGSFSQVDGIFIRGLAPGSRLKLETYDSSRLDFSLVLPVITKAVSESEYLLPLLRTLTNKFLFEKGLRAYPLSQQAAPPEFMAYLVEGLIQLGERQLAAAILSSQMDDLADRLRNREMPAQNSLDNTVPISTYLKLCGVEAITPREVILKGFNPFPGMVRVKFRDVVLMLHADKSVVLLNDQDPIEITSPERIHIPLGHKGRRS
jgi:hypothetical protein